MTDPYFILELATSCNLNCIYCYNVWKEKDSFKQKRISLSSIKKIIHAILEQTSVSGITLAGGEPLLNEDIFEIATFLSSENIRVNITSNGLLLNENNVKHLIDCGVNDFEISMPASDEEMFKILCGSANLKTARDALLNIRKYGARLTVSSVICKSNFKNVQEIIEMSAAFGADYFIFNRFVPGGEGKRNHDKLKLESDELIQALSHANVAAAKNKIPVIAAIPVEHCIFDTSSFKNLHFGSCGCGKIKWVVDPEGNLRCCEQNPDILGNLLEDDFQTLSQKAEVKTFCSNTFTESCNEKDCYSICGGGCRYCI